jgi:hypothetical protein
MPTFESDDDSLRLIFGVTPLLAWQPEWPVALGQAVAFGMDNRHPAIRQQHNAVKEWNGRDLSNEIFLRAWAVNPPYHDFIPRTVG